MRPGWHGHPCQYRHPCRYQSWCVMSLAGAMLPPKLATALVMGGDASYGVFPGVPPGVPLGVLLERTAVEVTGQHAYAWSPQRQHRRIH